MELSPNGFGLAGVLDALRDLFPERFDDLNVQLHQWLPEFNRVLFETPQQGKRALLLRTSEGGHAIPARELSQGTLVALAILTLNYLPNPPSIVCIEELDRGIHPRLLRNILDALYRLCYPEEHGETSPPVQVIATTHSPYLLDLFKDHPEEVVIVQKTGLNTEFKRLSDHPHLKELIDEASLGEVWYTGILGGVPVAP